MRPHLLILTVAICVGGCASISSELASGKSEGLVYFLPKKDVQVTVVKKTDAATKVITTTVSISSTAAFPDTARAYYTINFNRNLVGKNAINIGVSSAGLLSSAKSTSTSGLADALKNLAESAGMLVSPGLAAAPPVAPPCADGTHTFVYTVDEGNKGDACDVKISITRVASGAAGGPSAGALPGPSEGSSAGVFYRQEEAFKVTAEGAGVRMTTIVLSPSLSTTRFLPVAKSLFASAEADFGFVDGMPTKYDQNADGELIALLKLPADLIGAYFGAVGKLFDNFKTRDTREAEVLAASTKVELAKKKYDACLDAIKSKNDALVAQLGCGS